MHLSSFTLAKFQCAKECPRGTVCSMFLANWNKPLWDIIAHMVSNVPLPNPGKERVLFAIENRLLSVEAPPNYGLPHVDISFQPLVQCLDVDNLIRLFTAVLLERRILLRANKYLSYL
ncbi:putative stomatal cytokinesis defective protein [Trifolium medium]|uniref:Putative stomatal cytokinesis defective protein n=1 Tax=Trifolium medium TaxID=97028 RepID=A0A392N7X3_9FABA|nr:putative stomatal cytokinesis defective protein [Trifolium medium]